MVRKKVVKIKTNLLLSKMVLFGDTQTILADVLGITIQSVSGKVNGTNGAEFTLSEVCIIKDRYNLTAEEVVEIFFESNVHQEGTV